MIMSNSRHEVVMLERMLEHSSIPHFFNKHGERWRINYPCDPIGGGCVFTVFQLEEGAREDLVTFMDNETDFCKDMSVLEAYSRILLHLVKGVKS